MVMLDHHFSLFYLVFGGGKTCKGSLFLV